MQIIKTQDVCMKISVSRTTLWRLCQTEDFPKPVRLGPGGRSIGFFAHEIDAWLETQAAEREHAGCLARQRVVLLTDIFVQTSCVLMICMLFPVTC